MATEVVLVVGVRGGVGASTLAALAARRCAGARARAPGGAVALVDLQPVGGGVEVLLGLEHAEGVRWSDLRDARGTVAGADLEGLLPRWQGVEVLSGDRRGGPPGEAALAAVWPAVLERCSTVVVDLPPSALGDAPWAPAAAQVVLVSSQDVAGVAAGLTVRPLLGAAAAHLVLRRRPRARVSPLEAAHVLDLPVLALLPTDRRVADAVDRGLGPVVGGRSALARAADRVIRGTVGG